MPADAADLRIKFRDMVRGGANTTIAVIATDAVLDKASAKRIAIAAHTGFARAIWPSHTPFDGDLVFALATGASGIKPNTEQLLDLCALAAVTMSRAIARGVHAATPSPGDLMPAWSAG
jgi:L-aminopeptidase/D-esterase-like protein